LTKTFSLTLEIDDIESSFGDDKFIANVNTLSKDDKLDGLSGSDTLVIGLDFASFTELELPLFNKLRNFEVISVELENALNPAGRDQVIDFSIYSSVTSIKIEGGTTICSALQAT
jgi:hypothetical protein